jgi:hypothetical protein
MIDDELKDALRVDPSPEFLARVRTRIANEPQPSAWRWSWKYAAAGALAAAIVVAVIVSRPARQPEVSQGSSPAPPAVAAVVPRTEVAAPERSAKAFALQPKAVAPQPKAVAPPVAISSRAAGPNRLRASGASSSLAEARGASGRAEAEGPALQSEPEVLLDPRETRALRALIAGVRDGRIDLAAAQRSVPLAPMELAPLADIVIDPITIEPIAPPAGAEGVRP